MSYRKIKASQLFNGLQFLDAENVLITDEKGKVAGIVPAAEAGDDIEVYEGILSPGFINCHCHLELSHMKDVIPPHTGLIDFLCSVVQKRGFQNEVIQNAIRLAEKEMADNGIVAVGDICNTADALDVKSKSNIRWQNFIEVLSLTDAKAGEWITHYSNVLQQHQQKLKSPHRSVLVPHAPYTISPQTFRLLNEASAHEVISIHNQEHPAEDELYKTGGGDYLKLYSIFGMQQSPLPVSEKSSLQSYLPYFNQQQTILLIHNTYMPEEDILFANEYAAQHGLKLVYCLCPNANLYIENQLPPVDLFLKHNCHIVLGTDSYSSNWQLSIASEIKSVIGASSLEKNIALEKALQWATSSAAGAMQWQDDLGSFEKGKTPGVILIENDLGASRRLL